MRYRCIYLFMQFNIYLLLFFFFYLRDYTFIEFL